MREAVRSGRRANFYITENRFIDDYAAKVGGNGVAVYSILQRCANSETRETWISAGKMAQVLDIDKSTVYRKLKELEDLRLLKTLRTRDKTIYVILPVPQPRAEGETPLFDVLEDKQDSESSNLIAPTQLSSMAANHSHDDDVTVAAAQHEFAPVQQVVAPMQSASCTSEKCNKEEQDVLNKTHEQEFFNKNPKTDPTLIRETAQRIITILGLTNTSFSAAAAAVEVRVRQTKLSMDGVVGDIVTQANYAERRGIERKDFLDDFLARTLAQRILRNLGLPDTSSFVTTVTAAVKADALYTRLSVEQVAAHITDAALTDSRRGVALDRFYFENVKWRSHGVSKAERRTLDNLEVNARVKQRLRERLGGTS